MFTKQFQIFEEKIVPMLVFDETTDVGRSGECYSTKCILEVRGSLQKAALYKVTGLRFNESEAKIEPVLKIVRKNSESLSNCGNGVYIYEKISPGFYIATNIIHTGYRMRIHKLVICDKGSIETVDGDFNNYCNIVFEDDYTMAIAAKSNHDVMVADQKKIAAEITNKASEILKEITAERNKIDTVKIEEYVVSPAFEHVSLDDVIYAVRNRLQSAEETNQYIAELSLVKHWECSFEKADTPEEVVIKIKTKHAERKASAESAALRAQVLGLPELTGTQKQVAWALQIRDKIVVENPNDHRLRKAKTSKYWIDNRYSL